MNGWQNGSDSVAQSIKELYYKALERNSGNIQNTLEQDVKSAFTSQGYRPPVDTGDSRDKSSVTLFANNTTATLMYKIDTDQAKWFVNGWGSNAKYGVRNPMQDSFNSNTTKNTLTKLP